MNLKKKFILTFSSSDIRSRNIVNGSLLDDGVDRLGVPGREFGFGVDDLEPCDTVATETDELSVNKVQV